MRGRPPSVLLDALVARAAELHDVGVIHLHSEGPGPHLAPEMAGHFRHRALFIGPNARAAVNEGRADYVPVFLSDVPRLFDSGALPLDAVLVNATPPDAHGFCSLGVSVEAMHAAIRAAKTVIVQFNAAMPRTLGDSFIHVDEIDLAVEVESRRTSTRWPDRRHRAADRRVRGGARPRRRDAPARDRGDPRGDGAGAARQARPRDPHGDVHRRGRRPRRGGGVTGARKERNRGKIVTAFLMGSQAALRVRPRQPDGRDAAGRLHERHPRHPLVQPDGRDQLRDRGGPDRPGRGRLDRPSALQRRRRPDGLRPRRGPRDGGGPIIALPSTAAGGTLSRIAPALAAGAGVVTTRAHVRTVVTEWGSPSCSGGACASAPRR